MENNNNIGFIGSEGANQYSNPYQSDLYSQPSIKRQAHKIAEENKRASLEVLNQTPVQNSERPQQDITNLNSVIYSNNNLASAPPEDTITPVEGTKAKKSKSKSLEKIKKSNKMDREEKSSKAFLLADGHTTIPIKEDEDEKSLKEPRRGTVCCHCCPLWLCISITAAIIAFIGLMVFIFWPKIPDVNIANIELSQPDDGTSSIRYEFPSNDNDNKGGVEIDLDINVNVKNDNFYNLYVHKLKTRVFLQTANLDKTLIGKGEQSNLKFEKHQTTTFRLPLTIGYYVDDVLQDKALTYLLKACTYHQNIDIQYEVDIGIIGIDLIYSPTYKGKVSFQCPENGIQDVQGIQNVLIGDIYSSINDYFSKFKGV